MELEQLEKEVLRLKDLLVRVQDMAHEAEYNLGQELLEEVADWLTLAGRVLREAESRLMECREKAKYRCFMGLCPDFKRRCLARKVARKLAATVVDVRERGRSFDAKETISRRPAFIATEPTVVRDFEPFQSRTSYARQILDALTDSEASIVGVYGIGGVGKTTLVKAVARQAMEMKLVDAVVMVVVSARPDIERIQEEIADHLGLKLEKKLEIPGRAIALHHYMREKKVLVILDDLWDQLDLKKVGIPVREENKGCRILMTSRNKTTLSSMGADITIELGVLNEEEAWTLFRKTAGDQVYGFEEIESIAMEVARSCSGLPLALVTVARELRGADLASWRDALENLQGNDIDVASRVERTLKLSYDLLKGDEIKSLFLLCGQLQPHRISISDLLKYTMGLGLLKDSNRLAKTRNRLHVLVNQLKDSSLLLDADSDDEVKMHDGVRSFAISIASRERHVFMVDHDGELEEWPDEDMLKQCTSISLPYSKIPELPTVLKCPKLESFLLFREGTPSLKVPGDFFSGMQELKVLSMTGMHLSPLPLSLQFLENLRTLCLDYCIVEDIALIGKLSQLQILSMVGSSIVQLPEEIRNLSRLQLLDLSHCTRLEVIPPNVLARLMELEDLSMENCFVHWEVEGVISQRSNASLAELRNLARLSSLDLHITDLEMLPRRWDVYQLERFRIFIGEGWDWSGKYEASRTLKLNLNSCNQLGEQLQQWLRGTEDLHLRGGEGLNNILFGLDVGGFPQLKHLRIRDSHTVQHAISSFQMGRGSLAFPLLQSLHLDNLNCLEQIFHGQWVHGSFGNLRILTVRGCDRLRYLMPFSMAQYLLQLEEISITNCKMIEVIVAKEENVEVAPHFSFPKLTSLTLSWLPSLRSFYPGIHTSEWPKLKKLEVSYCDSLHSFASKIPNSEDASSQESQLDLQMQQSFFLVEKVPKLEELTISGEGMTSAIIRHLS